jgi:hypothetical protein
VALEKKGHLWLHQVRQLEFWCSGKKKHDGIDITATPNFNVHAMYSGTVVDLRNSFALDNNKKIRQLCYY